MEKIKEAFHKLNKFIKKPIPALVLAIASRTIVIILSNILGVAILANFGIVI